MLLWLFKLEIRGRLLWWIEN